MKGGNPRTEEGEVLGALCKERVSKGEARRKGGHDPHHCARKGKKKGRGSVNAIDGDVGGVDKEEGRW